jgi:hypothetical protein
MESEEDRLYIRNEIEKLPVHQRTVIVYFYYLNMSVKEIAKILSCNENTIKSRLFSGRVLLKKSIEAFQKQVGTKLAFSMLPLSQVLGNNALRYSISGNAAKAIFLSISSEVGIGIGHISLLWQVKKFIEKMVKKVTPVGALIAILLFLLSVSAVAAVGLYQTGVFDLDGKNGGLEGHTGQNLSQISSALVASSSAEPTLDPSSGDSQTSGNQSGANDSVKDASSIDNADDNNKTNKSNPSETKPNVLSATVVPIKHGTTTTTNASDDSNHLTNPTDLADSAGVSDTPTPVSTVVPSLTPTPAITSTPTLPPVIIIPPEATATPTPTPSTTPTPTPTPTATPTPTGGATSTAAEVAALITGIASPAQGDSYLVLPQVPAGYSIVIKSSGDVGIIAVDGKITLPKTQQTVAVILTITKSDDNTAADTSSIDVVVPRVLSSSADMDLTSASGTNLSGVLVKEDTSIAHQTGDIESNQTLLIVTISSANKSSAVLVPVVDHATVTAAVASSDAGAGGTKSGDYVPVDSNMFDVKTQNFLWIKVVSEDLTTTRYYSLYVQ